MRRFPFILLVAIAAATGFHASSAIGAPPDSLNAAKRQGPGTMIKFAPLALVDFQTAAMFSVHYQVNGSMYFQNEVGMVFPLYNVNNHRDYQDMWGIRNRFEIRDYFKTGKSAFTYTSVELIYNNVSYQRSRIREVSLSSVEMVDYYQHVTYRVRKQAAALHVKIGWELELYNRIYVDLYTGVGLRGVFIRSKNRQDEDYWDEYSIFPIFDHGNFIRPSGSLGFKLGYVIGKMK